MPGDVNASRRAQSKLLISKLLDVRDNASPLTLIIDSLEQSARPLRTEYIRRAKISKTKVIYISFETLRVPRGVDHFIPAHNLDPTRIQQEIKALVSNTTSRHLIIIDTLYQLLSQSSVNITTFLPSLLTPHSSLLAIYHSEQPLSHHIPYQPHPITLLKFLATTILTAHSLSHILASKAARDRSVAGPVFGLTESEEGTVQGLGANDPIGVVVECETRRKSGRATAIWFVVPPVAAKSKSRSTSSTSNPSAGDIILLEDHPLYRTATSQRETPASDDYGEVSFDLSLTEKQRLVREKVDLPYFDAQKDGGGSGEGGRILYDMGVEDDFDEEEDEI